MSLAQQIAVQRSSSNWRAAASPPSIEKMVFAIQSSTSVARDPGGRHLQDQVGPDPPALPDQGSVDVDAQGREVLPEDTVRERAAELGLPPVQVLACVGVDGLVEAAVMLDVMDTVARETDLTGALGTRGTDGDRPVDGSLVDACRGQDLPRVGARPADVDREHLHDTDGRSPLGAPRILLRPDTSRCRGM
jgi:hypothetical protein